MSDYRTHPEWLALVRAVAAAPADDLPRLVAADWLDEHGEPERAAFIRVGVELAKYGPRSMAEVYHAKQIERVGECGRSWCVLCDLRGRQDRLWATLSARFDADVVRGGWVLTLDPILFDRHRPEAYVRRGFVATVRLWFAAWYGEPCLTCEGTPPEHRLAHPCPDGDGGGWVPGCGPAVVAAHPVSRVELTNTHPYRAGGGYQWIDGNALDPATPGLGELPGDLFDALWSLYPDRRRTDAHFRWVEFPIQAEADDALSAAAIAWARTQPPAADTVGGSGR